MLTGRETRLTAARVQGIDQTCRQSVATPLTSRVSQEAAKLAHSNSPRLYLHLVQQLYDDAGGEMLDTNKVRVSKGKKMAVKSPTLVWYGVQAAIGTGVVEGSAWQPGVQGKGPRVHGSKGPQIQGILRSKLPSPATAAPFCSAHSPSSPKGYRPFSRLHNPRYYRGQSSRDVKLHCLKVVTVTL